MKLRNLTFLLVVTFTLLIFNKGFAEGNQEVNIEHKGDKFKTVYDDIFYHEKSSEWTKVFFILNTDNGKMSACSWSQTADIEPGFIPEVNCKEVNTLISTE